MGEMADLEIDNAILHYDEEQYDPELYWHTQFEGWVEIRSMTTQHLDNTVKMLERKNMQDHPSYFALVQELENR